MDARWSVASCAEGDRESASCCKPASPASTNFGREHKLEFVRDSTVALENGRVGRNAFVVERNGASTELTQRVFDSWQRIVQARRNISSRTAAATTGHYCKVLAAIAARKQSRWPGFDHCLVELTL